MLSANSSGYCLQVYPPSTKTQVSVFKACKAGVLSGFCFQPCCTGMKIELSVLSVYSVLSVSFYLDPCYTGIEIEPATAAIHTVKA